MLRGILFDLDGVLYVGDDMVAGAADTLEWVRSRGIPHLFVTNTTSRPRDALCAKLSAMGIGVDAAQILTPPVAAAHWLKSHVDGAVALFVPDATRVEFEDLPLWEGDTQQPVAAVVLGDLGKNWDFERLNSAFLLLMQQPTPVLAALGMTRYWKAPEGLRLDAGPFVAALEYAAGVTAVVLGKPAPAFFHSGAEALGLRPDELLMIGDDIRSDVDAARDAGLQGMLVKTGKYRPQDLEGSVVPDAVLASVAELPRWWEAQLARADQPE
jgi:phospholysine phosphohistidine inorganic pyrophosphate phosphatase